MKTMHGNGSTLRMISRCALTGALAGLLATPSFALGGGFSGMDEAASAGAKATVTTQPAAAVEAAAPAQAPAPNLMAAVDMSALPDAPAAAPPAAAAEPNDAASQNQLTSTPSTRASHHVRGGWLALGIAGTVIAGFGAYVAARGANSKWDAIFLGPGLGMAGAGYYFAFRK